MTGARPAAGNRRAVTPVVGIVLMAALTIVLAGTLLAFTLSIDTRPAASNAPTTDVEFDFDANDPGPDAVTVLHRGGDTIEVDRLSIDVDGAVCDGGSDDPNQLFDAADDLGLTGNLTAGETIEMTDPLPVAGTTLCSTGTLDLNPATVRLIWLGGEETSVVLQTWKVPG